MESNECLISDIYGDVDICTKEKADRMKILKKIESDIFSQYTMNFSKKFNTWW